MKVNYTREELIKICEDSIVPVENWSDRDTPITQLKVGKVWALLNAGLDFKIHTKKNSIKNSKCVTDAETIWLEITYPTFASIESGDEGLEDIATFYLPTPARLKKARKIVRRDWY